MEITKARGREIREKRRMLFPVRLVNYEALRQWKCIDADIPEDSAREIREYICNPGSPTAPDGSN